MHLFEMFAHLYEATPKQIYKNYNDKIIQRWEQVTGEQIPDSKPVVELMSSLAPAQSVNTYIQWLYKNWMNGKYDLENDAEKLKKYLNVFDKERIAGRTAKKDVMQYSLEELMQETEAAVEDAERKEQEATQRRADFERVEDEGEIEVKYEDDEIQILQPHSFDACRLHGREGSWCVSTDQPYWDDYSSRGDFYIINIKPNKETGEKKRKYGVHIEGGEWQNEQNERLPDEEIEMLVDEYPAIRDVLNDEAEEHGFEPVLGQGWVDENARKYAERAIQKYDEGDGEYYDFGGMSEKIYGQPPEWKKDFVEEVVRSTDTEDALKILKQLDIHKEFVINEAIDNGFHDDFMGYMEEIYGLSDSDYNFILKRKPDLIRDALSYQSIEMPTLYGELDREVFLDMLREHDDIAEFFFEPYKEEWINDPEDDDLVQALFAAMSSSGDNYNEGLIALDDLGDVGNEIKEAWEDDLHQVAIDVLGKHGGLKAVMQDDNVELTKEDILGSLVHRPENLHELEKLNIPISKSVAYHAIKGDPNFAIEWLFNKGYTIPSDLAQMALDGWEEDRTDQSVKDKLEGIAMDTDMF